METTVNETLYQARFHRPREIWLDAWIECDGIRINYRLAQENGVTILCRALKALGRPDGSFSASEVNVKQYALFHRYDASMHDLAKPYTPEPYCNVSPKIYADLVRIADGVSWSAITTQHDLLGRDLVSLSGATATLTELAEERMIAYKAAQENGIPSVFLTPGQREAFQIVVDNDYVGWNALHGKTRKFMLAAGWVRVDTDRLELTSLGQSIWHKASAGTRSSCMR